jgi:hypothetical protein
MIQSLKVLPFSVFVLFGACMAFGQSTPNPAMNAPDEVAWQLFLKVNAAAGGGSAAFETWASDADTFKSNPQFPVGPSPLSPHAPVVPTAGLEALRASGKRLPQLPPKPDQGEESRRNKTTFDFIVANNLYRVSGLKAAFGKTISFPVDSIEVKGNWKTIDEIPAWTNNRVRPAEVAKVFHVNTGADGKQYALVSMHIISKLVPNWTWATFENTFNPGRCDILGCIDHFGAVVAVMTPNSKPNQGYPPCTQTPELTSMFASVSLDPAFINYCLKGSQTDFTDDTGLDIRVGNSVTEEGFVDRSSCMTCHGRAAFDQNGRATSSAGFDGSLAPLGPINPLWYWSTTNKPPLYVGMPGLTRVGTSADFVWSIPFCALDDTVDPPKRKCAGK